MYKWDLALNNLQWLICHKTIPTNPPRQHLPSGLKGQRSGSLPDT